jgi:cation diffusion facilitator CzcD-associated flavoprotein CzcO
MASPTIAIIGSGFGGLAAAIELKKHGHHDLVILEKAEDVGGVWRENTYPGAACDVASPFYSFSFEQSPHWPHRFSRQPAILDYIRGVVEKYDLRRHLRLGAEVSSAAYDDTSGRWTVTLTSGEELVVDIVVSAVGQLSRPAYAPIAGRESFAGPSFHSATWDHSVDLAGKRVAVIGTGASAIQFVPAIQPAVGHLTVFQRTAPYLLPRPDREFTSLHHTLFEKLPVTARAERLTWYSVVESLSVAWIYAKPYAHLLRTISRAFMRKQAKAKPGLFEKIWPDYPIGCKRLLFSDDYVPALTRPNVDLVTDAITSITPAGVVTADGTEHPADVIVWGTGFKATEFLAPMTVTGRGGRSLHDDAWKDGARAYYGMTVPDFPGLFVMYGPNTNTGGGSIIYFLEAQARHLGAYADATVAAGAPLDVRREVEAAYDEEVQASLAGSVWSACRSWYRQPDGRITTNWPWLGAQYRARARFRPEDYEPVPVG